MRHGMVTNTVAKEQEEAADIFDEDNRMNDTTQQQQEAVRKFTDGMNQVNTVFQQSSAQVQALEMLALCLFATHPNPEGVRQMFDECSKRARVASERQTAQEAGVFHETFCGHLQRIADAMKAPEAAPGLH